MPDVTGGASAEGSMPLFAPLDPDFRFTGQSVGPLGYHGIVLAHVVAFDLDEIALRDPDLNGLLDGLLAEESHDDVLPFNGPDDAFARDDQMVLVFLDGN